MCNMLCRKLLCQFGVSCFDCFEDFTVFLYDGLCPILVVDRCLAVALRLPVQRKQRIRDHRTTAQFADQLVKLIVHLPDVFRIALREIELLQVEHVLQLLEPLRCHHFRGIIGGQAFDPEPNVEDVGQVVQRNAEHHGSFSSVINQPLLAPTGGEPPGSASG